MAVGLHGHRLEFVFWRGAAIGFPTPGIGRSDTSDWTIDGRHFAERCQAFVLIALGESIVVSGARLTDLLHAHLDTSRVVAFGTAFVAAVALWWVYFDRSAADSADAIARSDDPGRLGRNAFHWVHPIIVAGIIVSAAADEVVLAHPAARGVMSTSWLVLGGVALFLAGHAIFKAIVWRVVSWPRVVAVLVLSRCSWSRRTSRRSCSAWRRWSWLFRWRLPIGFSTARSRPARLQPLTERAGTDVGVPFLGFSCRCRLRHRFLCNVHRRVLVPELRMIVPAVVVHLGLEAELQLALRTLMDRHRRLRPRLLFPR